MSESQRRINCNSRFDRVGVLWELDALKVAFAAMAERFPSGSYDHEMAQNALVGIRHRIDYLHDSLTALFAATTDGGKQA